MAQRTHTSHATLLGRGSLLAMLAVAAVLTFGVDSQAYQSHRQIFAGSQSAQPGWVATATRGTQLANAMALGSMPGNAVLRINVALTMRDRAGADLLLRRQNSPFDPLYRTTVTPAQFTAMFNPTSAQVAAVAGYLAKSGFSNISVAPNNLFVSATATAAQASAAFHTNITVFAQKGQVVYANTTPALVPARLGGSVLAVLGLNNAYRMTPAFHRRAISPRVATAQPQATPPACINPGPVCALNSYTPQGFQKAYDVMGQGGSGFSTAVAVFAEGNVTQVLTDLRTEEAAFGVPLVPYSVVHVGIPSPDVAGLDEWDLDTQTSSGFALKVKHLYVYDTTSLSDSDTALEFNHFVTDDLAQAGNASFGICESFAFVDGTMASSDQVFLQGAAQGQTVFSSTGDNGNGCPVIAATGVPGTGVPEDSYPAASPYVVGVGGTTLVTNPDGSYNSEVTWVGSGGGVSQHELSPFWQAGIVPILYREAGRTLPDVSMDGDPNTGAVIYVNGAQAFIGGTSLSSPLMMGAWARMESGHHNHLGFAGPILYKVYNTFEPCDPTAAACVPPVPPAGALTQLIGGFHDILTGFNGGPYGTLPGYDLETGLGTIDLCKMQYAIPR